MWLQLLLGGCTIFNGKKINFFVYASTSIIMLLVSKASIANSAPEIVLLLKPRLCILSEVETHCNEHVIIEWQAATVVSLCLYKEQKIEPLQCWERAQIGRLEFSSLLSATTRFELRELATQKIMSQALYQVVSLQQKHQRARRNPWSFF